DPDKEHPMYPTTTPSQRRSRFTLAGAGLIAAAALVVGCAMTAADDTAEKLAATPTTAPEATPPSLPDPAATTTTTVPAVDPGHSEPDEDALDDADNSDDVPDPDVGDGESGEDDDDDSDDQGEDDGVDLDPDDDADPQDAGPCDLLEQDGSSLVAWYDPIVLEDAVYDGTVNITNCSDGDVDWTAATKPSVALATAGANILPGETAELGFTIDKDAWDPGAIDFKIKVSEPGHNHYVDVHGYRPLTGADLVGDLGLSGGEGVGGCALQCIVSAVLQPNISTPNLSVDITTNTPARIRTYVSTEAPDEEEGHPVFPGVDPMDTSPAGVTNHLAHLSPLEAGTKYYIIVSATDEYEHTAYRSGSFLTITPYENPDGFEFGGPEPGCLNQCITKALLTPGDHTSRHLSVESHTPALFQVFVSTEPPAVDENGWPSFDESLVWENSGLEFATTWEVDLAGLYPNTTHYIIVEASDAANHVDRRAGEFQTPPAPEFDVTFEVLNIHVDYDGDSGINRGELAFGWRVGDEQAGHRGEDKLSDGDNVHFSNSQTFFTAHGITDWLPTVYISATERDADGLIEFCSAGTGTSTDHGSNGGCDTVWSVSSSGLVTLGSLDGYPTCNELGFDWANAEQRCLTITTAGQAPGGYPEFTAYVGVTVNS
ncbi:MAG TPA: hypothetical protein VF065_01605, partial [Ilumatobacter sp.]